MSSAKSVDLLTMLNEKNLATPARPIPIRTLLLKSIQPTMIDTIGAYFSQFGEVKSVLAHKRDDDYYGFVEFKSVVGATAAVSNKCHRIANCDIEVEAAEQWHQPDQILNALNDDCLRVIFKLLNQDDLYNAADVCIRFNQLAKDTYSVKYKDVQMLHCLYDFEPMIRKFGSQICSLSVVSAFWKSNKRLLETIIEHTSHKLEDLKLSYFTVDGNVAIRSTLPDLKCIQLENFHLDNLGDLLLVCPQLKILRIESSEWSGRCINRIFGNLEEVQLIRNKSLNEFQFMQFLIFNQTLTKLVLQFNCGVSTVVIFHVIGRLLHNLVDLEIEQLFRDKFAFQATVQSLGELSSLENLKLNFNNMPVAILMRALATKRVPIKQLTLKNGEIDTNAIKSMLKLSQMETLELDGINGLLNEHIIRLTQNLHQLQHLVLSGTSSHEINVSTIKKILTSANNVSSLTLTSAQSLSINLDDYNFMLRSIQLRPKKSTFVLRISGERTAVNVPEDILLMNRDCLHFARAEQDK